MSELYADEVLTPEQLQAVGHVAIESCNLEILLDGMFGGLLNNPFALSSKLAEVHALVTSQLRQDHDALDKFNSIYHAGKSAVCKRNIVMHNRPHKETTAANRRPRAAFVDGRSLNDMVLADEVREIALSLARYQLELSRFFLLHGHKLRASP